MALPHRNLSDEVSKEWDRQVERYPQWVKDALVENPKGLPPHDLQVTLYVGIEEALSAALDLIPRSPFPNESTIPLPRIKIHDEPGGKRFEFYDQYEVIGSIRLRKAGQLTILSVLRPIIRENGQKSLEREEQKGLLDFIALNFLFCFTTEQVNLAVKAASSVTPSVPARESLTQPIQRRHGGPKRDSEEKRRARCEKWLKVQETRSQDAFCQEEGISVSTLYRDLTELGYR